MHHLFLNIFRGFSAAPRRERRTKDVIAPDGRVLLTDVPERNCSNTMAFHHCKETLQQDCVGHPDLSRSGVGSAQNACRAVTLEPENFTPLTPGCFGEGHRDSAPGGCPPISI